MPPLRLAPFPARRHAWMLACLALAAVGCSDDDGPTAPPEVPEGPDVRDVGVVLTSTDIALTLFDVEDPSVIRTVGLGPDGSPVTLAVRGHLAAVPLGVVPAVAVVDVAAGTLLRTVGLPEGSGATGVAFLNDSIALVANPGLGSVSPVNVLRGTLGEPVEVGRFPQGIAAAGGRAYVVNAELVDFVPAGPSTVTVLDAASFGRLATVTLGGRNAAAGAFGPDGRLFVIQSGSFGAGEGSLSIVDPGSLTETLHVEGFGDFPGSVAVGPDGRVVTGAFGVGLLVWDPSSRAFARGPDDPVEPAGVASASGVAFDGRGRLYSLTPDCQQPSFANRHGADLSVELRIPVGICPFAIAFTEVEDAG